MVFDSNQFQRRQTIGRRHGPPRNRIRRLFVQSEFPHGLLDWHMGILTRYSLRDHEQPAEACAIRRVDD
jgi:hypothetical protein